MDIANRLVDKLSQVSDFAAQYKERLSNNCALPQVLEMRQRSLIEAQTQLAYWTQRERELVEEIASKNKQLEASSNWLAQNMAEFERIEALTSVKAQKLGNELVEILREMETGESEDEDDD